MVFVYLQKYVNRPPRALLCYKYRYILIFLNVVFYDSIGRREMRKLRHSGQILTVYYFPQIVGLNFSLFCTKFLLTLNLLKTYIYMYELYLTYI